MKRILLTAGTGLFVFVLFVALFHTPLFAGEPVLFYRGLRLLTVASLLGFLLAAWWVRRQYWNWIDALLAVLTAWALTLTFFVLFPVTFERSLTMFLIYRMAQNPPSAYCAEGYAPQDLEHWLLEDYVRRYGAAQKRIQEQVRGGFFDTTANGCYQLSPRAQRLIQFSYIVNRFFGIQPPVLRDSLNRRRR